MIEDAETARRHAEALRASRPVVRAVAVRTSKRSPAPPFTTSTLQQEASRKLGFSPKRTMSVAQRLYEGVETPDGPGRAHHLHADGFRRALGPGARRGARGDRRAVRPRVRRREGPPLPDDVAQRPGGPRGDPAHVVRARAGGARGLARARRGAPLPPDLAARPGEPDDREAAGDDDGRPRGRRLRPARIGDAHALRRLQPGLHGGPRRGRGGSRADASRPGRGRPDDRRGGRAHPALHGAAAALHRGVAREGARGARRGPPVHVRGDALDDRRPRLRHDPGATALPGAGRRDRDRPSRRALRALRGPRVHGPDGGGARRDRAG